MAFEVRVNHGQAGDRAGDVYELTTDDGSVRAEVWPQWGFNCLRWQVRQRDNRWADILYSAPDWEANPVPTRSGHPILFPFPGRLRDGTFTHDGKTYRLPLNDSTKRNAIHGFTPRHPWRVTNLAAGDDSASVTGEFDPAKDFPEAVPLWPTGYRLELTYRLFRDRLRVEASVENLGPGSMPFGLGYHPYFRLPGVHDQDVGGHVLQANVAQLWETADSVPTGVRTDVPAELDYRRPRPIGTTELDNVFSGVSPLAPRAGGLVELATLSHPTAVGRVRFLADPAFRELVLFTPPHRQAVAIEPYTCSPDAANLAARGVEAGWRFLDQNDTWAAAVEYRWEPVEV